MSLPSLLLAVGGVILNIFVLPTVLNKEASVPRSQSITYTVGLIVLFVVPYMMLGMVLPALSTLIGSILWGYVALYRSI